MLHHLLYVSTAAKLMQIDDLTSLLAQSRARNEILSISGMLLYKDQSFIQLLEGDEVAVHTVFQSIRADSRHYRVRVLFDERCERRTFNGWSMGFANLDDDARGTEGFNRFFQDATTIDALVSRADKVVDLMRYFRANS
ncbi:BLUF domain-containing protein [Teredinibacter turnerae]|uniref:BLUF domain-containing protein n=1 Tax=Teredinibacter turnerae TaxID=2426 RepID=UPI0003752D81|nr:BLUF domain-containing protein [Teredinibacter turnerae]